MRIGVLPYHLVTREPPATAALLLGDEVVTCVPGPVGANATVAAQAATRAPAFRSLVKSWAWSEQLWREGVIRSDVDGHEVIDEALTVRRQIELDDRYTALRPLMRESANDEDAYLNAVAADLLKGGPDPGVLLPITAALDRTAAARGLVVARAHASSVAQRAEESLALPRGSIVLPLFLQADTTRILHARDVLADPLNALRDAIDTLLEEGEPRGLETAARDYARAFEASREDLHDDAPYDDVRLVEGAASLIFTLLPSDAVLRSSLAAMGEIGLGAPIPSRRSPLADSRSPVPYDAAEGRLFLAMTVRPLGLPAR